RLNSAVRSARPGCGRWRVAVQDATTVRAPGCCRANRWVFSLLKHEARSARVKAVGDLTYCRSAQSGSPGSPVLALLAWSRGPTGLLALSSGRLAARGDELGHGVPAGGWAGQGHLAGHRVP